MWHSTENLPYSRNPPKATLTSSSLGAANNTALLYHFALLPSFLPSLLPPWNMLYVYGKLSSDLISWASDLWYDVCSEGEVSVLILGHYLIEQKLRMGGGQRGGALPAFPATSQEISGSNLITPRRFDMCHQKTVEPRTLIEIILIQVTTLALIS